MPYILLIHNGKKFIRHRKDFVDLGYKVFLQKFFVAGCTKLAEVLSP